MRSNRIGAVAIAVLVVLAGCAGGIPQSTEDPSETNTGPSASSPDDGTVNFYVSDEENAIGDFEHLNVTITRVGFQHAGNGDDEVENGTAEAENASDGAENGSDGHGAESGGWIERDVDNRTVDLTELRGANATLLAEFDVPDGEYTKVFAHVGEVNATLANGEGTNVKLPSEKLQLDEQFTVGANDSVDFVFDIAVHEAGKSGKYILKPVIGESGTDVPIERIDGDERGETDEDDGDDLRATFLGDVAPGENVTVEVTRNGSAVENATVSVDDETVGTTDSDGRIALHVPDEATEFDVEVTAGEGEAELEADFEERDEDDGDDEEADLDAEFVGQVEAGETATVKVERGGTPVQNATVSVDDETVGTTDESGRLDFEAPDGDFEVTVEHGDDDVDLEVEFEDGNGNQGQ